MDDQDVAAVNHQDTADVNEDEAHSKYADAVSACVRCEEQDADIVSNAQQQQSAADADPAEERAVPLTDGPCLAGEDSQLSVEKSSSSPQADDDGHCDSNRGTPGDEEPTMEAEGPSRVDHAGEKKAQEVMTSPTPGAKKHDQVDGPKARTNEELPVSKGTNTGPPEDVGRDPEPETWRPSAPREEEDTQEDKTPQQEISANKKLDELRNTIENIGPTTHESPPHLAPEVAGILGGRRPYLVAVGAVVLVAVLVQHLLQPEPPVQENVRQIDVFLRQMENAKTHFPSQRVELWARSRIHLQRHLQTAQPTEPASLILTAGVRAKRTLGCLARDLASAFSSALNASIIHIDGASKSSQDSDQVKLDIDRQLQEAFEGDKPVAVIHRFDELPPGSTLIFYRYCDHENAAYKKTLLIFTVLLGEEEEIPPKIPLSVVEEMVDDHLQKRFLSHGHPVAFDMMDLDKYGGLWSRISHLILPVAAEGRIEHQGCKWT